MSTEPLSPVSSSVVAAALQTATAGMQSPADAMAALVAAAKAAQETVKVVFYCKDCEKIVAGIKVGNKYVYKCPLCHTKNVAFGTEKSIRSFYYIKD